MNFEGKRDRSLIKIRDIVLFVAVAGGLVAINGVLSEKLDGVLGFMALFVLASGSVLAVYFHRVNLGLSLMVGIAVVWLEQFGAGSIESKDFVWVVSWYLVGVVGLVLAVSRDSGLVSVATLVKVLVIVAGFLAVVMVVKMGAIDSVVVKLTVAYIDDKDLGVLAGVPQIGFAVCLLAFVVALIRDEMVGFVVGFVAVGLFVENIALLSGGGAVLIVALLMNRSYKLAYFDELTKVPNRRALFEMVNRLGAKYTVAMGDIDFFKKFNDTHGHDVGDLVLMMVARKLAGVKGGGRCYRYGGEEFTIVFDGKSANESEKYLEEVRKSVENSALVHKGKRLAVTVSIGASSRGEKIKEFEQVMKSADEALYKAKELGRNRVVLG